MVILVYVGFQVENMAEDNPKLTQLRDWREHAARVTCVAWAPNGNYFASGGLDCAIMIFNPAKSSKLYEVRSMLRVLKVHNLLLVNLITLQCK